MFECFKVFLISDAEYAKYSIVVMWAILCRFYYFELLVFVITAEIYFFI